MQDECTVANLTEALNDLLINNNKSNDLINKFREIHLSLKKNGNEIAANAIAKLLQNKQDLK
jgi:lipid A disaccharide synthetase